MSIIESRGRHIKLPFLPEIKETRKKLQAEICTKECINLYVPVYTGTGIMDDVYIIRSKGREIK